jgi:hypothetical protein
MFRQACFSAGHHWIDRVMFAVSVTILRRAAPV